MVTSPNKRKVTAVTLIPIELDAVDKQSAVFPVVYTKTFDESDTNNVAQIPTEYPRESS